jgi:hypothetical protein
MAKLVAGRLDTNFPAAFDADESKGLTIRVGPWRCASINGRWHCLEDGYLFPQFQGYDTRQEAVNFMVATYNEYVRHQLFLERNLTEDGIAE